MESEPLPGWLSWGFAGLLANYWRTVCATAIGFKVSQEFLRHAFEYETLTEDVQAVRRRQQHCLLPGVS